MNTPVTKVTIPTAQLKGLLSDDAIVEIERVAVEKIAEELKKKIVATSFQSMLEREANVIGERILNNCRSSFTSAWSFPKEAKEFIEKKVASALRDALKKETDEIVAKAVADAERKIDSVLNRVHTQHVTAINKMVATAHTELYDLIKKQARDEFLSVLSEVRGL